MCSSATLDAEIAGISSLCPTKSGDNGSGKADTPSEEVREEVKAEKKALPPVIALSMRSEAVEHIVHMWRKQEGQIGVADCICLGQIYRLHPFAVVRLVRLLHALRRRMSKETQVVFRCPNDEFVCARPVHEGLREDERKLVPPDCVRQHVYKDEKWWVYRTCISVGVYHVTDVRDLETRWNNYFQQTKVTGKLTYPSFCRALQPSVASTEMARALWKVVVDAITQNAIRYIYATDGSNHMPSALVTPRQWLPTTPCPFRLIATSIDTKTSYICSCCKETTAKGSSSQTHMLLP